MLPAPEGLDPAVIECERQFAAMLRTRADALAGSSEARDQLAYVVLAQTLVPMFASNAYRPKQQRALARALVQAPNDPLVAWMDVVNCFGAEECDRDAAVTRALRVDRTNLAVWMLAIDAAARAGDPARTEALLRQAATEAERIDIHRGEMALMTMKAIGDLPRMSACDNAAARIGDALSMDRPATLDDMVHVRVNATASLQMLVGVATFRLCPIRMEIPARNLEACRRIFRHMADSDELLYHLLGTRGLAMHAPPEQRDAWRERVRIDEWTTKQAASLFRIEHVRLAWEEGELAVMQALLEEAGLWPAPAGWLPEDAQARALIEGRAGRG